MIRNPLPQVYFLTPLDADGPIKVGFSRDVRERLRTYGKWSPIPLRIAAVLAVPDGPLSLSSRGPAFERRFHDRYAEHRLHHEWFAVHPLILADIAAINAGTFSIPEVAA
jgi:hypothetical protein